MHYWRWCIQISKGAFSTAGTNFCSKPSQILLIPAHPVGEMEALVFGLNWLLKHSARDEVFHVDSEMREVSITEEVTYPFLLANMGSGTSIIRVDGEKEFTRVSGSSLGGGSSINLIFDGPGTFWGLASLLTDAKNYSDLNGLITKGNENHVDLLVGDIYGEDVGTVEHLGLTSDLLACRYLSFAQTMIF